MQNALSLFLSLSFVMTLLPIQKSVRNRITRLRNRITRLTAHVAFVRDLVTCNQRKENQVSIECERKQKCSLHKFLSLFFQDSLQAKDYMNQRYLRKRALYLVAVAKHLKKCPLVESMSFTYHNGNQLKPLLVIKPEGR